MSEFKRGDRVQDVCWDGGVGTVVRINGDRSVFVTWDGSDDELAEYEVSPNHIVRIDPPEEG